MPNGGCVTQGDTLHETQMNMFEAMNLCLEDYPDVSDYCLSFEVQDA
jgi:predicted RNase H-like HicB family nuclease